MNDQQQHSNMFTAQKDQGSHWQVEFWQQNTTWPVHFMVEHQELSPAPFVSELFASEITAFLEQSRQTLLRVGWCECKCIFTVTFWLRGIKSSLEQTPWFREEVAEKSQADYPAYPRLLQCLVSTNETDFKGHTGRTHHLFSPNTVSML